MAVLRRTKACEPFRFFWALLVDDLFRNRIAYRVFNPAGSDERSDSAVADTETTRYGSRDDRLLFFDRSVAVYYQNTYYYKYSIDVDRIEDLRIRSDISSANLKLAFRKFILALKFGRSQTRVPVGQFNGGQWSSEDSSDKVCSKGDLDLVSRLKPLRSEYITDKYFRERTGEIYFNVV